MRVKFLFCFLITLFGVTIICPSSAQPLIISFTGEYYEQNPLEGYLRLGTAKGNVRLTWEDGLVQDFKAGDYVIRRPAIPGVYTVTVDGDFSDFEVFTAGWHMTKVEIIQWGSVELGTFYGSSGAFSHSADSIIIKDSKTPNLSNTTTLHSLFKPYSPKVNRYIEADFSNWNISTIQSLSFVFEETATSNCTMQNWNVSRVTYLNGTFKNAKKFNCDLSNWNVLNVEEMSELFSGAETFNQDLNTWDVSNVTTMKSMFQGASSFNQNLSTWDVSNVDNMSYMFSGATSFNDDINQWDVSGVTDMRFMFQGASAFNQNLSNWDVSNVVSMRSMFQGASSFNQSLNGWQLSNPDMRYMFTNANGFNGDISKWDLSKVTNLSFVFKDAPAFNQDISTWDVSSATTMSGMFQGASTFNQDLDNWDVSSVSIMSNMFLNATAFNGNIKNWDVSSVTRMNSMFMNASSFNVDISEWNINTGSISNMFNGAISFDQNLGKWNANEASGLSGFLKGVTLSEQNYDSLLVGWSKQDLKSRVSFNAGYSIPSELGRQARVKISNDFGWDILDGEGLTVKIEEDETLPTDFFLAQNYPNPFNPTTNISFSIPKTMSVKIEIFSINGSHIDTILDKAMVPGHYSIAFDASKYSSGTYFYRLSADSFSDTKKMILIK